jgi:hypothetical protein
LIQYGSMASFTSWLFLNSRLTSSTPFHHTFGVGRSRRPSWRPRHLIVSCGLGWRRVVWSPLSSSVCMSSCHTLAPRRACPIRRRNGHHCHVPQANAARQLPGVIPHLVCDYFIWCVIISFGVLTISFGVSIFHLVCDYFIWCVTISFDVWLLDLVCWLFHLVCLLFHLVCQYFIWCDYFIWCFEYFIWCFEYFIWCVNISFGVLTISFYVWLFHLVCWLFH